MKFHLLFLLLFFPAFYFPQNQNMNPKEANYISVNQVTMWIDNYGRGSHNPLNDNSGFYWPGGQNTKSLIYKDGILFAGLLDSTVYVSGTSIMGQLSSGKILSDGTPDDPLSETYRIYKLNKYWEQLPQSKFKEAYRKDYDEWPVEDGAPWLDKNSNGLYEKDIDEPYIIGDETLWHVMNDFKSFIWPGQLGIEIQETIYAYNQQNFLGDVIFKKLLIINKSKNTYSPFYMSIRAAYALGHSNDDYAGCDTSLSLAYCYNSMGTDSIYGTPPPATGYKILQGPIVPASINDSAKFKGTWKKGFKNLPMTSHYVIFPTLLGEAADYLPEDYYYLLQGRAKGNLPIHDPSTNEITKFVLPGDPVNKTGWYEGDGWLNGEQPDNRTQYQSMGPFTFAPGDTQEVAIAIIAAKGTDNLNSIIVLKTSAEAVQKFYDKTFLYPAFNPQINIPENFYITQNYPNPFNASTKIKYGLADAKFTKVLVYDILGREVKTLVNEFKPAGEYEIHFNAADLASGIYYYLIEAGEFSAVRKFVVLK